MTEVVLGVQFNSLERFLSPHLGLIWDVFREEFPLIEEHAYFPPVFETFGASAPFMFPSINIPIMARPEMARIHFINRERTQLLQVQRDRLIHNWRKIGQGADYPRFEKMIEVFETGYRKFVSTIDQENLGPVVPNQCEVSYINQIAVSAGQTFWSLFASTFPNCSAGATVADLGHPEDMTFAMRYVIPAAGGGPLGRVTVAAQPAKRADGTNIIQFTLTARGKPATA
ncbi:MAG: TIGR04255 family protein, partial [Xanthobacteraceae bacterium]